MVGYPLPKRGVDLQPSCCFLVNFCSQKIETLLCHAYCLWSYGNLPRCATSKTPLGFPLTWAECDTNTNCNWSSPPKPQIVTTKTTHCHHQYHRLSLQILQPPNQYFQDQNLKCMKFKSITETINLPNAIKKSVESIWLSTVIFVGGQG